MFVKAKLFDERKKSQQSRNGASSLEKMGLHGSQVSFSVNRITHPYINFQLKYPFSRFLASPARKNCSHDLLDDFYIIN